MMDVLHGLYPSLADLSALALIVFLAGTIRSFTGFGSGLVMAPSFGYFMSPSNVVAVTRYGGEFQAAVEHALRSAFPGVRIVELETEFSSAAYDPAFGSAQGVYVNAVVTDRFLYLPVYGTAADDRALAQVSAATDRKVIPVSAGNIGKLGGSVRCLCSQMEGANARILIAAARRD